MPIFIQATVSQLLKRYICDILPLVDRELSGWEGFLRNCPDLALKRQALDSLRLKRFHSQGGAVFALLCPSWEKELVSLIVAVQTISDYLDNLCDRMSILDARSFRVLHRSMLDCYDPDAAGSDYYRLYPHYNDGGYLDTLVAQARAQWLKLPGREAAEPWIRWFTSLYCDLQTYKHMEIDQRKPALEKWAAANYASSLGVSWWEFSAASGSTLGVFALMAAATRPNLTGEECGRISTAYFPWICGLHILLDYLIDQEEDLREGDFNFTRWYSDGKSTAERLSHFIRNSFSQAADLPCPNFHTLVVQGLLALYLSDPKTDAQSIPREAAKALLDEAGGTTRFIYRLCRYIRNSSLIRRRFPHLRPVIYSGQ